MNAKEILAKFNGQAVSTILVSDDTQGETGDALILEHTLSFDPPPGKNSPLWSVVLFDTTVVASAYHIYWRSNPKQSLTYPTLAEAMDKWDNAPRLLYATYAQ